MVIFLKIAIRWPCAYACITSQAFFIFKSNYHAIWKLLGEASGLVYRIGERDHAPRFSHHLVHYRRDPTFLQCIIIDSIENAVMDGPTATSNCMGKFGLAETSTVIQFTKENPARLKQLMDPLHLGISGKIAETVSFIGNRIVIKKGLQTDALDIKHPAEKLKLEQYLATQSHALSDLPGKKPSFHGPLLFGKIPGSPAKQGVSSLPIHICVELGGGGIVDDEKIPIDLSEIV
jgi:hypothetical protein